MCDVNKEASDCSPNGLFHVSCSGVDDVGDDDDDDDGVEAARVVVVLVVVVVVVVAVVVWFERKDVESGVEDALLLTDVVGEFSET